MQTKIELENISQSVRETVNQSWSHQGRPWPRGHILKSLALASKPQILGLEALGPRKLPCPGLEESSIF